MPSGKVHITVGLIIGGILCLIWKNPYLILIGIIYADAPDLDQPGSYIAKLFVTFTCLLTIYVLLVPFNATNEVLGIQVPERLFVVIPNLFVVVNEWIGHRNFYHSILAGIIFSAPIYLIFGIYGLATALIGYGSHLFLDRTFTEPQIDQILKAI